jgi:hypothetical protein
MGMTARASHMFQVAQNPQDLGFGTDPDSGMTLPSLDMDPSEFIQHLTNLVESDSFFAEGRNSSMSPHDGSVLLLGDGSNIGLENFIASLEEKNFAGINVTLPYKNAMFEILKNKGFENLIGVDPSSASTEITQKLYGIPAKALPICARLRQQRRSHLFHLHLLVPLIARQLR